MGAEFLYSFDKRQRALARAVHLKLNWQERCLPLSRIRCPTLDNPGSRPGWL